MQQEYKIHLNYLKIPILEEAIVLIKKNILFVNAISNIARERQLDLAWIDDTHWKEASTTSSFANLPVFSQTEKFKSIFKGSSYAAYMLQGPRVPLDINNGSLSK